MPWTLTIGATKRTLAEWGVSGLRLTQRSQAADVLRFTLDGAAFDAEAPFTVGATLSIARDAVGFFSGRVTEVERAGSGAAESLRFTCAGPWWYLDNWVFQVPWPATGNAMFTSQVLLNLGTDGLIHSTREQVLGVLQFALVSAAALGMPAPFQIGNVLSGTACFPPIDEVRNITCAEAVRKQLRWHPDAVAWFDYTAAPPVLHIRRRAELARVTFTLNRR